MTNLQVGTWLCLIACCGGSFSCSKEWQTVFHSSCYLMLNGNLTWEEASLGCRELGGHLAIVTSKEEQKYLHEFVYKHQARSLFPLRRYWLDGKDEESENHWYWEWTGNPIVYTNWNTDEPSNSGNKENCLGNYGGGVWNDFRCDYKCHAICEKDEFDVN